jgi:hypothetical protein
VIDGGHRVGEPRDRFAESRLVASELLELRGVSVNRGRTDRCASPPKGDDLLEQVRSRSILAAKSTIAWSMSAFASLTVRD